MITEQDRIDSVVATEMRIKAEYDSMRVALRAIIGGCDMMLQPACALTGSFLGFVTETKRVATEGLYIAAPSIGFDFGETP